MLPSANLCVTTSNYVAKRLWKSYYTELHRDSTEVHGEEWEYNGLSMFFLSFITFSMQLCGEKKTHIVGSIQNFSLNSFLTHKFKKMKIAIITGAGSGIGKETTLALLKAGYGVVLAGRTREKLEAVAAESKASSGQYLIVPTDVANPASVDHLFAETKAKFGRLDLLFNNAGINHPGYTVEDLPFDKWQQVIDINLTGSFLCAQGAFRLMREQNPMGGRIINNGSISASTPRPNSEAYTVSKHGITGLTKSLALSGRKYNIACGQIDIGNAMTDMAERMTMGVPQANGEIAIEPTMSVKHVAEAVLYMDSLPLEANVLFMTVMASFMPFVGRG